MNAKDLFELAKQGYKLADIKELVELGNTLDEENLKKADDTPKEEPKGADGESGEGEKDYQAEIDNLTDQLNKANDLIKSLQAENIKKASGEQVDELAEIGKLFI